MKKSRIFACLGLLSIAILIALDAPRFINCALNGLSAWAFNVLPCILPFMIITKLIIELEGLTSLTRPFAKPFNFLFGTSSKSAYVFFMSILAGYPVGSKMTADLYESGQISRETAFRMSSFCSNSGPMFIVGTVGAILLKSAKIGGILFLSHVLSALLNGLIYRRIKVKDIPSDLPIQKKQPSSFGDIVQSAVTSVLSVGGIICFFFIIIELFSPIFALFPPVIRPLLEGMVELTRGCIDAAYLSSTPAILISSFLISFGGFSTILQSLAMLKKLKMPVWLFSVQKLTQGLISVALTGCLIALV